MTNKTIFEKYLIITELAFGIMLTLLIGYLYYVFMNHAGGLWRDEVMSFNIATYPSFIKSFEALAFDSFPGFLHLLLRLWNNVGLAETDQGIRLFGFIIGLSFWAAFWLAGYCMGYKIPLFSSILIGLSPLTVFTTSEIRGYGVGTTLIILALGLMWKVTQKPSAPIIVLACIVAVLSVHSLYQNSFLLAAICFSACVVTVRHQLWKRTFTILGVGAISALSLLIYIDNLPRMQGFRELFVSNALPLERLIHVFSTALSVNEKFMLWVWLALVLIAILLSVYSLLPFKKSNEVANQNNQDLRIFSIIALISLIINYITFLKMLNLPTQTWYYIPLMAPVAVLLDAVFSTLIQNTIWRTLRLFFVAILSVHLFFQAIPMVETRLTNIDFIADKLTKEANKNDLILVVPWYCGTTFARYFHGNTPWVTLPPLEDFSVQRLDLFKKQMMLPNPTTVVMQQIAETLENGNNLWIVGNVQPLQEGEIPPELPPAPNSQWGWDHDAYSSIWEIQTIYFIQQHAQTAKLIPVAVNQPVLTYENLPLLLVNGWRD